MAKQKKVEPAKPKDDVVFEYEVNQLVMASLYSSLGAKELGQARVFSRRSLDGQPVYWLCPKDRAVPLQHVNEADIRGADLVVLSSGGEA